MPSVMPEGEPAPGDGALPEKARSEVSLQPLGIYFHVPFCTTRCGYCDFNTYTATELGSGPGASRAGYVAAAIHELDLAARVLGPDAPVVSTISRGWRYADTAAPDDLGRLVTAVQDRLVSPRTPR
jgi:oxygen-independent coproporphyrinogen-3 oxidase